MRTIPNPSRDREEAVSIGLRELVNRANAGVPHGLSGRRNVVMDNEITRRDFVQKAGGLAAVGAMGALLPGASRLMAAADAAPVPGAADWPRF